MEQKPLERAAIRKETIKSRTRERMRKISVRSKEASESDRSNVREKNPGCRSTEGADWSVLG